MSSSQLVLDTDILSLLMRKNSSVLARATEYLAEYERFTISIITRYEILRGLKAKGAEQQASRFEDFCANNAVLPITDDVVVRATDIYAELYRLGALIGDADILIAASALVNGFAIVTNNEEHFRRVKTLRVLNWLQ
jgi:tRNA(fMet)-specific endonuclease VapC